MDNDRIVDFERALWIGGGDVYRRHVSGDCLMVVPEQPFLLRGQEAIDSVEATPRWSEVDFTDFEITRPQEGLIVVAYHVDASRGGERYSAYCTSTYQRRGDQDWVVIQHQQTPRISAGGERADVSAQAQESASDEREDRGGYQ